MKQELTLLKLLLATCRNVRRCNPDIETSKVALAEEQRLQGRIDRLEARLNPAPEGAGMAQAA